MKMKHPLTRKIIHHGSFLCCLFLLVTVVAIPRAEADDPKEPQCVGGNTIDDIQEYFSESGSSIVTELTEPLGGFDDTITSDNNTVSAVYWKYNCYNVNNEAMSLYIEYSDGSCPEGMSCTTVQIIIGTSGIGILKTYIAVVYRWAAGIVGIIAVLVMIISGIQISMDQGSGEAIGAAKTRILQSLAGLAVLFLSALILYTINPTFFTQ
jgi:hypothetical protein